MGVAGCGAGLGSRSIQRGDQAEESDDLFLTRLRVEDDTVSTVKNEYLLFILHGVSNSIRTAFGVRVKTKKLNVL